MRNRLLGRQIRQAFNVAHERELYQRIQQLRAHGDMALADGIVSLLQTIDHSYQQFERDLQVRSRMLDISSAELIGANEQLRAEAERQREILQALQASIEGLTPGASAHVRPPSNDFEADLLRMTRQLKQLVAQGEQARTDLAKAEVTNRRMLNNLREVVFQTDLAGHWVYLNPAWETITGFRAVDSLGTLSMSYLHPDDHMAHLQRLIALLSGHESDFRQNMRYRTRDGSYRWLQVFARRLEDERGQVLGLTGSLIDITEQKQAQDQLAISEERLRQALKAADSRLWDWDMSEEQPYVEEAWLLGLGYKPEQLPYVDLGSALHPDDAVLWRQQLKEHLKRERPELDLELRIRTADGAWRYTALRGKVIEWRGRRAQRIAGILQDISARKAAEQEARRQRELTEQILDQLPFPIFLKDRSGKLLRVNRQFLQYARMEKEDLIGKPISAIAGPGWTAKTSLEDEEAWNTGRIVTSERKLKIVDPPIHLLVNRTVIASGDESYLLGFAIDVSEQRAAREAMQRAVEAAEASSRAKSEFLANMSHEIRTPMNGILGMTELVLESPLNPQQREDLALVKGSADALLAIVNDILDFSKIEAGKLDIEDVPFDLRQLALDCVRSLRLRAEQKGLQIACELPAHLPAGVKGDPGRLRQVLLNLLGNAIKFTEHGRVVLALAVGRESDVRCDIHFAVRDTGIGIPADKQQLVFEAFAQADGSTTREYGGTGLGLTICRRLVILMQGELQVQSELGVGSTFSFTLPLAPTSQIPVNFAPPPLTGEVQVLTSDQPELVPAVREAGELRIDPVYTSSEQQAWRLRVLLAEDNPVNQRLAVRLLERFGHHITLVDNGIAALEHASAGGFDLILLDVQMPGLDGLSVARHLRQRESAQGEGVRVPVIAMTARAMSGDRERCLEAGMDDYLPKPIDAQRLRETLARFDPGVQQALLDWENALQRLDQDEELLLDLAALYLEDGPDMRATLAQTIDAGDGPAALRAVHSLKGVLVNFGAARALDQLDKLSQVLHGGERVQWAVQLQALGPALDDVDQALREVIAERRPA